MPTIVDVPYEMKAGGSAVYRPQRAPAGSRWGGAEVHPQKVAVERNGQIALEANGDWIVSFAPEQRAPMNPFAFKGVRNGKPFDAKRAAEMLAAQWNAGAPTRVVGYDGEESESPHTATSVQAALDAANARK